MRVKPLERANDGPIGLIVNHEQIIGEWGNGSWERTPKAAKLYSQNAVAVRFPYLRGSIVANTFGRRNGNGKLSSWDWYNAGNYHRIYNLKNTLTLPPEESMAALLSFGNFIREHSGSIGSLAGMAFSLFRTTLKRPLTESGELPDMEYIARGGRLSINPHAAVVVEDVALWDIASAHAYTIGNLYLPRRWKRYSNVGDIPDVPTGFGFAIVDVPPFYFGPLPVWSSDHAFNFPAGRELYGVWTLDELRAARDNGCKVIVGKAWIGGSYSQPFLEWWRLIQEARDNVGPVAYSLIKQAANAFVGTFAAAGYRAKHWMENGQLRYSKPSGPVRPLSLPVHALVTGKIRARLFDEVLFPYAEDVVSCHTDGVLLTGSHHIEPNSGKPGTWREKMRTPKLRIVDPANYSYVNSDGEIQYVMAGVPSNIRSDIFSKRWQKLLTKRLESN